MAERLRHAVRVDARDSCVATAAVERRQGSLLCRRLAAVDRIDGGDGGSLAFRGGDSHGSSTQDRAGGVKMIGGVASYCFQLKTRSVASRITNFSSKLDPWCRIVRFSAQNSVCGVADHDFQLKT